MKNQNVLSKAFFFVLCISMAGYGSAQDTKVGAVPKKMTWTTAEAASRAEQPRPGEVLLTRISTCFYTEYDYRHRVYLEIPDNVRSVSKNFKEIGFKSKRLGRLYYDEYGDILNQDVPVFVKKNEHVRHHSR